MNNLPVVKLGIVAVSRDCFPIELSQKRRAAIKAAYKGDLYECPVTVENEQDMLKAVEDVKKAECNALVVFLGNFGPETPETLIAKNFDGPCMFVAAAEGDGDMINGRGDAYCGMLNCSYNLGMRHLKGYIPEYPVGDAEDCADMIHDFLPIARAIEGERARQIELLEAGKKIVQETRRWDDNKEYSYPMRSKEDAQDYRYFPEPDLPPLQIPDEWIERLKSAQPELRDEKMARYKEEYEIPDYDADIITGSKRMADIFEETVALGAAPKKVSNWLMTETMRLLKEHTMEPDELDFSPKNLATLISLVEKKTINQTVAKEVFEKIFADDIEPESYVKEHGLGMVSDTGALQKTIEEIIAANPQSVADYKAGKQKAIGFLVGQTMKAMKGKANPTAVNEILVKLLNE